MTDPTAPTPAAIAGVLRRMAEENHERFKGRVSEEPVEKILLRGFGVVSVRERVAQRFVLTPRQAKNACEAAVREGALVKVGGGSNVSYVDGELHRAEEARRAEIVRRRTGAAEALNALGVEVEVTRVGYAWGEGIVLGLDAAEALVARLRGDEPAP